MKKLLLLALLFTQVVAYAQKLNSEYKKYWNNVNYENGKEKGEWKYYDETGKLKDTLNF